MEESLPPEIGPPLEEQIRALGFDPGCLTRQEQEELLELHLLCPEEVIGA